VGLFSNVSHVNPLNIFSDGNSIGVIDDAIPPFFEGFHYNAYFNVRMQSNFDTVEILGARRFHVGQFPVLWETLLLAQSPDMVPVPAGKIVNGGGDELNPLTAWSFQAWVEDDLNGVPFDGFILPGTRADFLNGVLLGNGLQLVLGDALSGGRILGADNDYWLAFSGSASIASIADWTQVPNMSITGELGLHPGFYGFDVLGRWQAVPEPNGLAMIASLAAVMATVRCSLKQRSASAAARTKGSILP
jgi:hypothetical protein